MNVRWLHIEEQVLSCWEYQGEDKDPVMLKEDLNYQFVVPQTRNYKK